MLFPYIVQGGKLCKKSSEQELNRVDLVNTIVFVAYTSRTTVSSSSTTNGQTKMYSYGIIVYFWTTDILFVGIKGESWANLIKNGASFQTFTEVLQHYCTKNILLLTIYACTKYTRTELL